MRRSRDNGEDCEEDDDNDDKGRRPVVCFFCVCLFVCLFCFIQ